MDKKSIQVLVSHNMESFFIWISNYMMSINKAIHVYVFSQVVSVSTTLVKQKTLRYMGKHIRRLMRLITYMFLLQHIGATMIGSLNRRWVPEDTDHAGSNIQDLWIMLVINCYILGCFQAYFTTSQFSGVLPCALG